jgi:hypothetical protein
MKTKILIKLSLIIDKMGIAKDIKNIDKPTNEEVGKELIMLLITNLYKAENEIYEFIADYKKITKEEAEELDVIPVFKELLNIEGMKDFL